LLERRHTLQSNLSSAIANASTESPPLALWQEGSKARAGDGCRNATRMHEGDFLQHDWFRPSGGSNVKPADGASGHFRLSRPPHVGTHGINRVVTMRCVGKLIHVLAEAEDAAIAVANGQFLAVPDRPVGGPIRRNARKLDMTEPFAILTDTKCIFLGIGRQA
jgi:hypothetical protein